MTNTTHDSWNTRARLDLVHAAAHEIERRYVFPERGAALAAHLRAWAHTSEHSHEDIPLEAFCRMLTREMRAHTPDGHLRVEYQSNTPNSPRPAPSSAHGLASVQFLDEGVGLLEFVSFGEAHAAAPMLAAAMRIVENARALVLDLRRNGGGDSATTALLLGYFFASPVHVTTFFERGDDVGTPSWTPEVLPSPRFLHRPVVVLTSGRTGSGGEEVAYVLRHTERATLFGEVTAGAAHPGQYVALRDDAQLFVPTGRPVSPLTNGNWEGVGVEPHHRVSPDAALEVALDFLKRSLS